MDSEDSKSSFDSIMAFDAPEDLPAGDALPLIGRLIDLSTDLNRPDGARRAIELADRRLSRDPPADEAVLLHYFASNAWSVLQLAGAANGAVWNWHQPEIERQLVHLRSALTAPGFAASPPTRRCQILTNLGNLLSDIGRMVEAVEYWDRALEVEPRFGMARANRGRGRVAYAGALYDDGHRAVFLRDAHADLSAALRHGVDPHARSAFEEWVRQIEDALSPEYLKDGTDFDAFPLGQGKVEREYRQWCLSRRLFLNPLNDLGPVAIAARDILGNPTVVTHPDDGPTYVGFYNQLKQEFVTARLLLYEGTTARAPHFADRDVCLYDTSDYPVYSVAAEKTKLAFRAAYSLFDKIAYFLNDYLGLGIPERQVSFKTLWFAKQKKTQGLRPELENYRNWPLRGLFWLGRDLSEEGEGVGEALEPDGRELSTLRNHAEHKYLKLHDPWSPSLREACRQAGFGDRLACSAAREDFEAKALRVLKLARSALIYLSLGMTEEERRRAEKGPRPALPINLPFVPDDEKR